MSGWTRRAMSFSSTCGIYVRLQNRGRPGLFIDRFMRTKRPQMIDFCGTERVGPSVEDI